MHCKLEDASKKTCVHINWNVEQFACTLLRKSENLSCRGDYRLTQEAHIIHWCILFPMKCIRNIRLIPSYNTALPQRSIKETGLDYKVSHQARPEATGTLEASTLSWNYPAFSTPHTTPPGGGWSLGWPATMHTLWVWGEAEGAGWSQVDLLQGAVWQATCPMGGDWQHGGHACKSPCAHLVDLLSQRPPKDPARRPGASLWPPKRSLLGY